MRAYNGLSRVADPIADTIFMLFSLRSFDPVAALLFVFLSISPWH